MRRSTKAKLAPSFFLVIAKILLFVTSDFVSAAGIDRLNLRLIQNSFNLSDSLVDKKYEGKAIGLGILAAKNLKTRLSTALELGMYYLPRKFIEGNTQYKYHSFRFPLHYHLIPFSFLRLTIGAYGNFAVTRLTVKTGSFKIKENLDSFGIKNADFGIIYGGEISINLFSLQFTFTYQATKGITNLSTISGVDRNSEERQFAIGIDLFASKKSQLGFGGVR